MVFDDEIIAGIRRMEQGITLHDPSEEVALIKSRTPRGCFMSAPHTLRNYRQHWYPNIINRDTYATWL
jgi:trimethylamine:corrinoid methyltransferase-like protein